MKHMKHIIIVTVLLLGAIWGCAWLFVSVHAKQKYDTLRKELSTAQYAEVLIDQQANGFLSRVQSHWIQNPEVNGKPDSDVVKLAGMTPSVRNLIRVFNYQMPEYDWFSLAQNKQSAVIGLIKAKFFPVSVDRTFHVAEDGHLAFLWCRTNMVYVYRDETNGLSAKLYFTKTNDIEHIGAP
jgi:hypothetical protein